MTKEEALKSIEELQKFVDKEQQLVMVGQVWHNSEGKAYLVTYIEEEKEFVRYLYFNGDDEIASSFINYDTFKHTFNLNHRNNYYPNLVDALEIVLRINYRGI